MSADEIETVVYITLDLVLAFLVICGNVLVCCVILHSRVLRKKAMYMFVTSLAFADVFVGMTAIPFGILTKLGLPQDTPALCIVMLSFIMISTQISIFNMMAICIERYLAIRHPRVHFMKLTPKTSFYVILITWLLSILIGLLPVLGWNKISNSPNNTSIHESVLNHSANLSLTATSDIGLPVAKNVSTDSNESPEENHLLSADGDEHMPCKFMQFMDENYMFFNFVACVLPPLFVCAGLYLAIFLSLRETKTTLSNGNKNLQKSNRSENYSQAKYSEHQYEKSSSFQFENGNGNRSSTKAETLQQQQAEKAKWKEAEDVNDDEAKQLRICSFCNCCDDAGASCLSLLKRDSGKYIVTSTRDSYVPDRQSNGDVEKDESDVTFQRTNHKRRDAMLRKKILLSQENRSSLNCDIKRSSNMPIAVTGRTVSEGQSSNWESPMASRQTIRHLKTRKELHAAGVLGVIVLAFVLCWMPIHVLNTITRFDHNNHVHVPFWMYDVAILLSHANSAVNLFLYSWRLKAFRKQLHQMIERKMSCIRICKER